MSQENGLSEIMKALYHGKKDVVDELLASGVELNVYEAAATGQTERLRELIAEDPSLINSHAIDGFTPLGLAVFFGRAEAVNALLEAGADVNLASRESMKVAPLASASAAGQYEIARVLIAHGANVNARAAGDFTPLHESAASGRMEFARLLLDHGADVNARTTDGKTPVDYAREHNREEMVALLNAYVR
ncbi:MAG TPA: ankyrin repeat domain-containing protein [Pyrinomonadaceae bacterium]